LSVSVVSMIRGWKIFLSIFLTAQKSFACSSAIERH
jgi:hypothetical protein